MKGSLYPGEAVRKEWAYTNLDTLIVTNKRLIHEYRIKDSYFQKEEVKLDKYTRIESTISYGRVNIILLIFGILWALGGLVTLFLGLDQKNSESPFADLGSIGIGFGIALSVVGAILIAVAIIAKFRTSVRLKIFKPVDDPRYVPFQALGFGMSAISSINLKSPKANREEATDLFNALGSVLLVEKEVEEA